MTPPGGNTGAPGSLVPGLVARPAAVGEPRDVRAAREAVGAPNVERVMVCMSSNPLASPVIRTGAQIAKRLGAKWYTVSVETRQEKPGRIDTDDSDALRQNIRLAESLGATVVRVEDK